MQGALSGIRVLDLSRLLPGPCASMMLREMGATVDKIEEPLRGDYLRDMPPLVDGENACFRVLCAGNRSIALDLGSQAGRETLLSMLPQYDVLLESFRPGVMSRWSLDHQTLRAKNPRLIHCAISGYGVHGAAKAGHDLNFLADAGVLALSELRDGTPAMPGIQGVDVGSAMLAAARICAALFARSRSGDGAFVDVAMYDAARILGIFSLSSTHAKDDHAFGRGPFNGGLAVYNVYRAQDERFLAIAALEPKFLRNLAAITGLGLDTSALVCGPHQDLLRVKLAEAFRSKACAEWLALSQTQECCLSEVRLPHDKPWPTPRDRAPKLGEHTNLRAAENN